MNEVERRCGGGDVAKGFDCRVESIRVGDDEDE